MVNSMLIYIPAVLALACIEVLVVGQNLTACGDNQHYNNCGTHCPDNCTHRSIGCHRACDPGCFCNQGFIMEDYKTRNCIPLTFCDSCNGNTRYSSCGTDCPATCDNQEPAYCNDKCLMGCVCKDGYIQLTSDKTSECVLPSQCPSTEQHR